MHDVVVVIPIYKKNINIEEEASLRQCFKVLTNYPLKLICPENLDITVYKQIAKEMDVQVSFIPFDKEYFESIITYNKLMLSVNFYLKFVEYKYMLVYQLDAWVFRDELEYWCRQGLDYIGAPWFDGYGNADYNSSIKPYAGNGGFSLRNIQSFIDVLSVIKNKKNSCIRMKSIMTINAETKFRLHKKYKILRIYFSKENLLKYYINNYYEDLVIVEAFPKVKKDFRLAKYNEGLKFSFEVLPERLYELNNNELPFGCHAFSKYNYTFWKQFIDIGC